MTTIKVDKDIITLINVFTVDPSRQQQLVDALIETTRQVWRLQDGFISASIHKSKDRKKVVNYVQITKVKKHSIRDLIIRRQ